MKSNYRKAEKAAKVDLEKEVNLEGIEQYIQMYIEKYGENRIIEILIFLNNNESVLNRFRSIKEAFSSIISEKINVELKKQFEKYLNEGNYTELEGLCKMQITQAFRDDFVKWIENNKDFSMSRESSKKLPHYLSVCLNAEMDAIKEKYPYLVDVGLHTSGFEYLTEYPEVIGSRGERIGGKKMDYAYSSRFCELREKLQQIKNNIMMNRIHISMDEAEEKAINTILNDDRDLSEEDRMILEARKHALHRKSMNKNLDNQNEGR